MISEISAACMHGFLLAIGLIVPLGVQNVFVFNQGASHSNFVKCFPTIITAAICDTALIILAISGVSLLILEIGWIKNFIFGIGFFFLIYMGSVIWRQHPKKVSEKKVFSVRKQILFATSFSLFNPHAIIDTIMVIGASSVGYDGLPKLGYTLSCISVSWIWFFVLAIAGHNLHRIDKNGFWITKTNKIAALIMWCLALYLLWELLPFLMSIKI
jgi:L-lysine exporter family protein LysE/ArgO